MMEYNDFLMVLAILLGTFIAYLFVMNRLASAVQPLRIYLAERGELYLLDDNKPDDRKKTVRFFLNNAFRPWVVVLGSFVLPFVLLMSMVRSKTTSKGAKAAESDQDYERLSKIFTLSVICANPIFGTIFVMQMVVILFLSVLVTASFNKSARVLDRVLNTEWSRAASVGKGAHAM